MAEQIDYKEKQFSELVKLIEKKRSDERVIAEIVKQVKHPKVRVKETDLTSSLKDDHVRFGVVSDTQLNSEHARVEDILPTCYAHFKKSDAAFVVHCGDITDGCLYLNRSIDEMKFVVDDDILQYVITAYPKENGLKTYFIGGNDDRTFITKRKKGKIDICEEIARERSDLIYLGMTEANIKLAPKTRLNLLHPLPSMGSRKPYTISYPLQQIIDKLEGGEKPDILCVGYYHKIYNFIWRDVHAFLAGTTQNQTPTMKAKQLGATVGAWLIDVHVDKKGALDYVESEVIPFYK